jgi:hypothetical protein
MRKMYSVMLAVSLLGVVALAYQQNANVAGAWDLTVEMGQRGPMTQEMSITQDGEKIEVTMKGRMGETKGPGTVKGNAIEWSITRSMPQGGGEMTFIYKGTVEGDNMTGEVAMGERGNMKWTATRKK